MNLDLWSAVAPPLVNFYRMGERAVLAQLVLPPNIIAHAQLDSTTRHSRMLLARAFGNFLRAHNPAWADSLVTGYDSVLLPYDPAQTTFSQLCAELGQLTASAAFHEFLQKALQPSETAFVHRIPVIYGGRYGPDLAEVARLKKLTPAEVIQIHSSALYSVYLVGFAVGYAYMGALPPEIDVPRLAKPRPKVPKGSVSIAAGMSGIYPVDMPGGWSLLGYTPLVVFDPLQNPPVRFLPGDQVQFYPISEADLETFVPFAQDFRRELP